MLSAFYILFFTYLSELAAIESLAKQHAVMDAFTIYMTIGELIGLICLAPALAFARTCLRELRLIRALEADMMSPAATTAHPRPRQPCPANRTKQGQRRTTARAASRA